MLLFELSVDGGRPLLGGLSGVWLSREPLALTMVETAGTSAVASRLDLDLS